MEIESLLAAISPEAPCGPSLEYDADFLALEQASRGKAEQQFGDTVVPAEEPDWGDVRQRALALFCRTKDLRVAVALTRALARSEDMPGLGAGLALLHGLVERHWDHVHPQLDTEENGDPTMRLNALAPLADPETMLRELRTTHLIRSGTSKVLVKDILVAAGKMASPGGETVSQAQIEAMIQAAAKDNMAAIEAARAAQNTATQLHSSLIAKVGAERAPDLRPLTQMLKTVVQVCDKAVPVAGNETEQAGEGGAGVGAVAASSAGEIRTREDAIHALDRVCEFMERTEPAHPAPLFIRRAQRLMSKNFVEIIQDLAPDSLKIIQQLTGLEKK